MKITKTGSTDNLATSVLASITIGVFFIWSVFFVPANMDEFCAFHRLACLYPNSYLNTFTESCSAYPIDFGFFSYHRSFSYIGITSSLLYFPLWTVWKSPYSFYLLGIISLIIFSLALVKSLGLERKYLIVPLCYFPVAFSFIHDTGPVRLGLLSFPILAVLAGKLHDNPGVLRKLLIGLTSAVLIILCVEDKPFYLYLIPTLLFFVMGCRAYIRGSFDIFAYIKRNKLPLVFGGMVLIAGLYILLFVGKAGEDPYFVYLAKSLESRKIPSRIITSILFTFSFPGYGHRIFDINTVTPGNIIATGLFSLVAAFFFLWLILVAYRDQGYVRITTALFAFSYISGLAVFFLMGNAYAGQHYIFLHIPIVALLLTLAKANRARYTTVLYFVLLSNILSVAVLSGSPVAVHSERERTEMFEYLSRQDVAKANIINFSSWGGYYHQSLYGDKNQIVTWTDDPTKDNASQLRKLARMTSRKIINAGTDCNLESMRVLFDTQKVVEIGPRHGHWRMFQIDPY